MYFDQKENILSLENNIKTELEILYELHFLNLNKEWKTKLINWKGKFILWQYKKR